MNILKNFLSLFKRKRAPRLAIALGSGGAKGAAHVGVLRAFEEEGISFDIVTGCSIGSIVGGMYARGFSTASMLAQLKESGVSEPQQVLAMKLRGVTLKSVLDGILGGAEFDELAIPFAAVASNLDTGKIEVLNEGNVASAMCASSAIPPVFKDVQIGEKRLVDGAFLNNVPADVAKKMGADFVIGVSLGAENPKNDKIKPALDMLYKNNKIPLCNRARAGIDNSDYFLAPDLTAYTSASYKSFNDMYEIGYELAKNKMPEIKALLKKANII